MKAPGESPRVAILIPCHNGEVTVARVLAGFRGALSASGNFCAICFGTTLTVAIVHSSGIDRYLHLLSARQSLVHASALVLTLLFPARICGRFRVSRSPAQHTGIC